jgi:hypothetical protein
MRPSVPVWTVVTRAPGSPLFKQRTTPESPALLAERDFGRNADGAS